ncbi:LuxR family transcriptional regulator [Parasedimentitalea marina]|uniref:LuxR family transcriptional regulator n=1 Tax=Parasedimentitalea marina TaxID=2483033 RepID=A0A3T0N1P2_9RHOB|nr:LuxR family transcriptional regulator [Parasedimentitalea marina]AZV77917.1 LuxR family transcriptional regulator [Parasedimentitalea marina]
MKSDIKSFLFRTLEELSDGGYSVGVGFQGVEPHFVKSTYSSDWVERYIEQNFIKQDPTIQFGLSRSAYATWEDLEKLYPDSKGFFAEARAFGLLRGNTLSVCVRGQVSILSCSGAHWDDAVLRTASAALYGLAVLVADVDTNKYDPLSPREKEVLNLMTTGSKDQEIANILKIKVETVRARRRSAFLATNTTTIGQLMSEVIKKDLI